MDGSVPRRAAVPMVLWWEVLYGNIGSRCKSRGVRHMAGPPQPPPAAPAHTQSPATHTIAHT